MARSTSQEQRGIRYGDARQTLLDAVGAQLAIRGPRAVEIGRAHV